MTEIDSSDKLEKRVSKSIEALDNTISRVTEEAKHFKILAVRQQKNHTAFRAITAILSVAAPALVTYQTTVESAPFQLAAIFLVGFAGASATLQATFGWGEKYGRTRLTALSLEELESDLQMAREDILDSEDKLKIYQKLRSLNEQASDKRKEIYRKQIEAEVQIVTKEESPPKLERDNEQ